MWIARGGEIRLQVRFADASGSSHTTLSIAQKGGVAVGSTHYYQLWYRTTANPPCGASFADYNTTNGVAITWGP